LFFAHVTLGIQPKILSSLDQNEKSKGYPYGGYPATTTRPYYPPSVETTTSKPTTTKPPTPKMANGFPLLSSQTRGLLEQCVLDQFMEDEEECGNNPYAGLLRLGFHDCATFDSTNHSFPGGCNAWSSIHCTEFDKCEFTSVDNEGLQPWVLGLDTMYDSAQLNGKKLSEILSRADFWHLAANRAIMRASNFSLDLQLSYWAGRKDPYQISPDLSWGPRFPGRIPQFFAFSEMERVAARNGMTNFHASALLGGHTLGHAHPSISGFRGSWDPTPTVFDNIYWQVLQGEDWFITHVEGVNEVTGEATNMTQYSLGGVNAQRSIQLFADVGQLVGSTFDSPCPVVKVFQPNTACPVVSPPIFEDPFNSPAVLRAWAQIESTFFAAFQGAWDLLSQWGCDQNTNPPQCPLVDAFSGPDIQCGINLYRHQCKPIFKNVPRPWEFPQGEQGPQGPSAPVGEQGPQGPSAPVGEQGPQGPTGGDIDPDTLLNGEKDYNARQNTPPSP